MNNNSIKYKHAIDRAELSILKLCKAAVLELYTKAHFVSSVNKIISIALKDFPSELKGRFTEALRTYATQTLARMRELLLLRVACYAVILAGVKRREPAALPLKKKFENEVEVGYTASPAFRAELERASASYSPTGLPLDMYHKAYQKKVHERMAALVKTDSKEDGSTNVNLRNIAEMQVRYEHQLDMIRNMRESGTKLVYIVPHANCSERCEKYQVGGSKHPSGLYSLDGTSGVTPEGIKYLPLEFATDNEADRYTTRAGKTYQNGCLTGFNCRHTLKAYAPGNKPLVVNAKEIKRRREVEEKQRQYERQIREYSRGAILCDRENSEKKRILEKKARERYEEYHKYCVDNRVAMYPERIKPFKDANLY